jgi:GT2 family glycosyltransferase/glycosyltransferase involved in cell wall biosynthesis
VQPTVTPLPRVSIVIVNYRSADHTLAAIRGIRALDWPRSQVEVIVVDNASGDGSCDVLRAGAPEVVLVESTSNTGFAGGCNLGVAHATGDYVAFLNPDARPDRAWLSAAIEVLEGDRTIGCVASKVLDWEGERIDYASVGMSFDGQGYKLDAGEVDTGAHDQPTDVLFPTGSAMVMPTELFRRVGGFDERFFMFFEDVDLGWRLWLLGFRVRYVPTSLTFHRHHVTMERLGSYFESYLLARNAIYTVYKNYDEQNLGRILPATLLLALRRGTAVGELDRHSLDLATAPPDDGEPTMPISKHAVAALNAADTFLEELPSLTATRRDIQDQRVRTDAEISRLFKVPFLPNIGVPAYVEAVTDVIDAFDIRAGLTERRRIVIATSDTLTPRMAGPAIRAWHMAKALSVEHDVKLVTKSRCEVSHPDFECRGGVGPEQWVDLERWCDVVIFQGFLLFEVPSLIDSDKIIVVDLYDPFHLEQLELGRYQPRVERVREIGQSVRVLNDQVRRGDFFLCASEKQWDFWLGQLSAMQRVNPYVYDEDESLKRMLAVVPFGVADEPPERTGPGIRGVTPGIGPDDKVLIWGGGIYNWFDPITLIRAVDRLRQKVPEVRLYFLGTKHPNPDVPEMKVAWEARQLADELGLLDSHVFFNDGWVPYDERQNYFLDADIGVTTHLDHVETEFSFRTRVLDYLWTSLPVVTTAGDTLADLVESRELGLTVPALDVDALEEALYRMLTDEALIAECKTNAAAVAAEFRWSNILEPLLEFCRSAERAPDSFDLAPVLSEHLHAPGPVAVAIGLTEKVRRKLAQVRIARRQGGWVEVARKATAWTVRRARAAVNGAA